MFSNRTPWVILLLVWMAGSTWWHVCKIKQLCADDVPASSIPSAQTPALIITDGGEFRYEADGNYSFAKSGEVANAQKVGTILDSLTQYLRTHPGKTLLIEGNFSATEQNKTTYSNLGLARAEGIKQILKKAGISDSLLLTTGVEKNDLVFSTKGDSLYGGLAFSFKAPAVLPTETPVVAKLTEPVTEKELAEKETFTSVFKPIDLYFPSGKATYIKTGQTTQFFNEATQYLAKNKGKKLILTGYTDSSGPEADNLILSRKRANSMKATLSQLGIDADQIEVRAMGEANPKADNSTSSGQKANRRVTVVVN